MLKPSLRLDVNDTWSSYTLDTITPITGILERIIAGGREGESNFYDDILEYNAKEDSIVSVGKMTQPRYNHAVSIVQAQDYAQCWMNVN